MLDGDNEDLFAMLIDAVVEDALRPKQHQVPIATREDWTEPRANRRRRLEFLDGTVQLLREESRC
jgi:hypothetical protein